jgi:transcriptional regulator with XRE-family HTH domain
MQSWEFGRMLRRWRDRVEPSAVGLPTGGRRRAKGLRREELAGLAGISPDYLTRLEQGRARSPSVQVVEALVRGLRLGDIERDLFYREAGHAAPGPDLVPSRISPSVQRFLDRFENVPLVVYDATWNLLLANAPHDALMGETGSWLGIERNAIWRNFLGPAGRILTSTDERAEHQGRLVADLRQTASRYPTDRSVTQLVKELSTRSPRFVELWETGNADPGRNPARRKVVDHPSVGRIAVDCDTLLVAGEDLRLMIYSAAPGTADAERLALALVLGTQTLVD